MKREFYVCINNQKKIGYFISLLFIVYIFFQNIFISLVLNKFDFKNIVKGNEYLTNYISQSLYLNFETLLILSYFIPLIYIINTKKRIIYIDCQRLEKISYFLILLYILKKIYELLINEIIISDSIIINNFFFFFTINYILVLFTFCIALLFFITKQLKFFYIILFVSFIAFFSISKYYSACIFFAILTAKLLTKFKIKYIFIYILFLILILFPIQKNIKFIFQATSFHNEISINENIKSRINQNNERLLHDALNIKLTEYKIINKFSQIFINEIVHIFTRVNQLHIVNLIFENKISYNTLLIDGNILGKDIAIIDLNDFKTGIDPTFVGSIIIYYNSNDGINFIGIILLPILFFYINKILLNTEIGFLFISIVYFQYIYILNSSPISYVLTILKLYVLVLILFIFNYIYVRIKKNQIT